MDIHGILPKKAGMIPRCGLDAKDVPVCKDCESCCHYHPAINEHLLPDCAACGSCSHGVILRKE